MGVVPLNSQIFSCAYPRLVMYAEFVSSNPCFELMARKCCNEATERGELPCKPQREKKQYRQRLCRNISLVEA